MATLRRRKRAVEAPPAPPAGADPLDHSCLPDPTGSGYLVDVRVPLRPLAPGYCQSRLEAQLNPSQAATLRRLTEALQAGSARMADGRPVTEPRHAIGWLLDRTAAADRQ